MTAPDVPSAPGNGWYYVQGHDAEMLSPGWRDAR
jgi:hypothetical protein